MALSFRKVLWVPASELVASSCSRMAGRRGRIAQREEGRRARLACWTIVWKERAYLDPETSEEGDLLAHDRRAEQNHDERGEECLDRA